MYFDEEERQLIEEADKVIDTDTDNVYVIQFNLRNFGTKAKLFKWDKGVRRITLSHILFTIAIFN